MKEFFLIVGWSVGTAASIGIAIISVQMIKEIIYLIKGQYQEIKEAEEMYFFM